MRCGPGASFLRRQEPARARHHFTPLPIHPSPLLGGRLGGGCGAPSDHQRSFAPRRQPPQRASPPPPFLRLSTAARISSTVIPAPPHSVIPAPPIVIPAQTGTCPRPPPLHLSPNSSLPPFRGEARWGVRRTERPPAIVRAAPPTAAARVSPTGIPVPPHRRSAHLINRHSCAPFPSFLRRQEPARARHHFTPPPIHPSPLLGGRLGGGCGAPSDHQRFVRAAHLPRRHSCASNIPTARQRCAAAPPVA